MAGVLENQRPFAFELPCRYHLHMSDDDPNVIVAYEIWRSRKQLEEHLKTAHIGAFWVNRMDFLTEDADIRFCTEI
jgi:quinol monooxygenase YgiN